MADVDTNDIYNVIHRLPRYANNAAAWPQTHLTYNPATPRTTPSQAETIAGARSDRSVQTFENTTTATSHSRTHSMASDPVFDGYAESTSSWATSLAPRFSRQPAFEQQFAVEPELPPLLWCEFYGLPECDFRSDSVTDWVQHHIGHMNGRFPKKMFCWFCDEPLFVAASSADRQANFVRRMQHVAQHIRDEGTTISGMRPDFYIVEHMHKHGQLDHATYQNAMQYTEVPEEFRRPTPEPNYRSTSSAGTQVHDQAKEDRRRKQRQPNKKSR